MLYTMIQPNTFLCSGKQDVLSRFTTFGHGGVQKISFLPPLILSQCYIFKDDKMIHNSEERLGFIEF